MHRFAAILYMKSPKAEGNYRECECGSVCCETKDRMVGFSWQDRCCYLTPVGDFMGAVDRRVDRQAGRRGEAGAADQDLRSFESTHVPRYE